MDIEIVRLYLSKIATRAFTLQHWPVLEDAKVRELAAAFGALAHEGLRALESAAAGGTAATGAPATFMTEDQASTWAWDQVRQEVGTEGWTTGDSCNFFGFFLHGWRYRGQYELQRAAALAASQGAPAPRAPGVGFVWSEPQLGDPDRKVGVLRIDLPAGTELYATPQGTPAAQAEPTRECNNADCAWTGPTSTTVHPKHDPSTLLCPECRETTEAADITPDGEPSNVELRGLWYGSGGEFHGPRVETGSMPEARLLPFLRSLIACPPAQTEPIDLNPGLEAAARWVDKRREAFDAEHGRHDSGTGAFEYGQGEHAQAKAEYSAELAEIAEGIRALPAPTPLFVDDLRTLVARLAHSLRKAAPGNDLPDKALDYLQRKGLTPTALRSPEGKGVASRGLEQTES